MDLIVPSLSVGVIDQNVRPYRFLCGRDLEKAEKGVQFKPSRPQAQMMDEKHITKKRLLIIPGWYPSVQVPWAGIFIEDQALALAEKYAVLVVVPEFINWKTFLFDGNSRTKGFETNNGITVYRHRVFLFPKLTTISILVNFIWFTMVPYRRICASWGTPAVIHAHVAFAPGLLGLWLGKKSKVPVVLTEHSGPFNRLFTSTIRNYCIDSVIKGVDRVIAVSPALARQINAIYPQKNITVIGNLVRTDIFSFSTQDRQKRETQIVQFFSVAIMFKAKGIDYLIEAARLLKNKNGDNFKVIIGGDGVYRKHLEKKTMESGVSDICVFTGLLTREEVKKWMQQSDVFIVPSIAETFCVSAAEAMACGKPVISTRCGGPEYFIDETCGFLVPVADAEALADKMQEFISKKCAFDPSRIRTTVEKRFGRHAFLSAVTTLYDSL
jgi:L-malate glycosyltransferase